MRQITIRCCAIFLLIMGGRLMAQDDAATKAWMAYMTPGEMHQMLAKDDGEWAEEITMWMAPGASPSKSTATAVNKMIMGGRYQESKHSGSFMGQPFEGYSLVGYDNAKKTFHSIWIDNMGTGVMHLEGQWDPQTKTINFKGMSIDPSTGKEIQFRETFRWIDDNRQLMEMFMQQDGKEFKSIEIKFTRK